MSALDAAHAAMGHGGEAERLAFYAALADSQLFLLLEEEPEGEVITPRAVDAGEGEILLAFDSEDRLVTFTQGEAAFAAMSGRGLVAMMAGQGLGLGLNLEAPSATVLPPEAIDWLAETLGHGPEAAEEIPVEISVPQMSALLLRALDGKLASAAGLAKAALLAQATYRSGARGHLLAFVDAVEGAEHALAGAANEALKFSGLEAEALDVAFLDEGSPLALAMARHGMRFDLPEPETPEPWKPAAPGSDPNKPPKLR
ncbi:SseB family protein [Vannielia litorea]|uniref:SseB protein N-terminal domain-containing protein n=1 Tax=Vannielia litorea TaxID=1217970 RepID=A0A1N6GSM4_9RHOB|nr:SseB family protein [Vannielia litorea]SIO10513.1 SseB protein N-terminal domain-containing protein [Vannielia litorea]